jgi:hypothetical protein
MLMELPYGSKIKVLSPPELVGEWLVVDVCAACEARYWSDALPRFDFLMSAQVLPWAVPVRVEVYSNVQN